MRRLDETDRQTDRQTETLTERETETYVCYAWTDNGVVYT